MSLHHAYKLNYDKICFTLFCNNLTLEEPGRNPEPSNLPTPLQLEFVSQHQQATDDKLEVEHKNDDKERL